MPFLFSFGAPLLKYFFVDFFSFFLAFASNYKLQLVSLLLFTADTNLTTCFQKWTEIAVGEIVLGPLGKNAGEHQCSLSCTNTALASSGQSCS